jgi:hypothetical protein
MSPRRFVWVGCGEPAAVRIEVYSTADGVTYSLDASVYACNQHADNAAAAVLAAGLVPHRGTAPVIAHRACGFVYRYPTAGGEQ